MGGRAIILTTHSMDEAEVLSSRIGIMALGSLRCIGTPLHLKHKYASGYLLTVNYKESFEKSVVQAIKENFPDAVEGARFRGTTEFRFYSKIGEVFERIEEIAPK